MRLSENALDIALVAGRSRVRRSRAVPPVRLLHPRSASRSALVFSSALGGGMLEGDDYRFDITCREHASLMFAPQANTRVFPCPDGGLTRQSVRGTVYANGLVVSGGDPVVPYAGSRFSQSQNWVVHPGGRLVLFDWMIAGRLDRGEAFAFDSFESDVRIEDPDGRPLLRDAILLEPGDARNEDALSPSLSSYKEGGSQGVARAAENAARVKAGMGGYSAWLTLHVLGAGWESLHAPLEAKLREASSGGRPAWMDGSRLAGIGVREGRGFSLRALGVDRAALEPLAALLFAGLAAPDWLGFDFWARKY